MNSRVVKVDQYPQLAFCLGGGQYFLQPLHGWQLLMGVKKIE
jgi:hypothetical protein